MEALVYSIIVYFSLLLLFTKVKISKRFDFKVIGESDVNRFLEVRLSRSESSGY